MIHRSNTPPARQRGNASGKLITAALVIALLVFGGWLVFRDLGKPGGDSADGKPAAESSQGPSGEAPDPIEPVTGQPRLDAAAAYQPKDDIVDVDISEYAGYAGLIAANGGLAPNPDSFFAKNYGF